MAAKKPSASRKLPGFHAVVGSDEGVVRERAHALYQQLTGGVDDGFTHETIDGNADTVDAAHEICSSTVQALQTLPMFGGEKVVWLRGVNFLGEGRTAESQRTLEGLERLRDTLASGLPASLRFLLSASAIDKRRSFWKFLDASAEIESHDRIDTSREGWEEQVASLVRTRARTLGLAFSNEALELFVMLAGEASGQIANELEKLDLFLGPERRQIEADDVRQLVPLSRAAIIFEIGRAIQQGDAARAIACVDQQLASGESAIAIIRASIIPTVRNLFMAKLIESGLRVTGANYSAYSGAINRLPQRQRAWLPQKKDGSGVNVFPIFLARDGARRFSLDGLRGVMEAALKADESLVTTGLDPRLVLHRLVAEVAAARG